MFKRMLKKIKHHFVKKKFLNFGEGTYIDKEVDFSNKKNISIGHDTFIGKKSTIYATLAPVIIGNYVLIGPEVMIITGNHRTDIIGEYMAKVTNEMKLPENDQPIIIEDDVWIGARAIILKGVRIGRGSVVAAGTIVTKDIPPYTVYLGFNKSKPRFNSEEIIQHEKILKKKYGECFYEKTKVDDDSRD